MDPNEQINQIASRLRELEDANAALTRRVYVLETEISKVAGIEVPIAPIRTVAAPPPLPPVASLSPPLQDFPAILAQMATPEVAETVPVAEPTVEGNIGLKWVNRIGVLTTVLAVGFFFKYMVDSETIGPAGRVPRPGSPATSPRASRTIRSPGWHS